MSSRSAYAASVAKEQQAKQRLMPFLQELADDRLVIDVNAGNPLGLLVQKQWGDFLVQKKSRLISVEFKADFNDANRICLESWSNLNLGDYQSYLQRGHTVGWTLQSRAMALLYYWYHSDRLILLDLFQLQRWTFEPQHGGAPNIERWQIDGRGELKPQFPYYPPLANQLNRTWVRWVPLPILQRELMPKPIETSVQQLNLDLGDQPLDRWQQIGDPVARVVERGRQ